MKTLSVRDAEQTALKRKQARSKSQTRPWKALFKTLTLKKRVIFNK
jgi:hypothetical protein